MGGPGGWDINDYACYNDLSLPCLNLFFVVFLADVGWLYEAG